ncbi:hypothetical protein JYK02_04840 [Corallococcus macrosporus]|uniref:DUF3137 domain-containing protein n=1 Tax=Corallococcus macrosporus TaxID=35 RepID=A0ABS3D588_9BACT|nr:hypothetical protein [Corallococcus macrosporus]MBN8226833.1 hypothetical protein [Corallococcus macrosporus]
MAAADGINPTSQALVVEGPLSGVMSSLAVLPETQKSRRFWRRVWTRLKSLARLGTFLLCVWIAGTAEAPLDAVAGVLAVVLGLVLWFRNLLPNPFHAEGHPGDALSRRPELVLRVLRRLKADLAPDASVRLRLRPDPRPQGPGSSFYEMKFTRKVSRDVLDPWLLLETRLVDGAHLRLSAVERRRVKVSNRRPDGTPRRTRSKEYDTLFLEARLRVKAKRHPQLATLSEKRAREAVHLPPGATLQRLRVTGERLLLRIRLEESWLPYVPKDATGEAATAPDASRAVTMMLLSLYQMLHFARTPAARRAIKAPPRPKPLPQEALPHEPPSPPQKQPHPRAKSRRLLRTRRSR